MDIMLERILSLIPRKPDGKFVHGAQKEFAQTVGLKSGNLISDWISGRSSSYTGYVYEIAAKYDVSVEWLRGETDERENKNPVAGSNEVSDVKKRLIQKIVDGTDDQADFVLGLIDRIK